MTNWKGRPPTSFTETLYNADIPYNSDIRYDGMIIQLTQWAGRPGVLVSNTIEVIMTGIWDDTKSWDDTLYWNDAGNTTGTTWIGRTIPT